MAAFLKLHQENRLFNADIFDNHKTAESYREIEFRAAILIQSWFRGLRTRQYLKHLNKCAVLIQKTWRGYMGRIAYRIKLDAAVKKMMLDFYNQRAVKIQKRWRGFFVRKYVHNFYARKRYLEMVQKKNAIMREHLEDYNHQAKQEMARHLHEMRQKRIDEEARKSHFLMSTSQIPGVYNSPYRIYPHEMEFHMKNVRYTSQDGPGPSKASAQKSKKTASENSGHSGSFDAAMGSKSKNSSKDGSMKKQSAEEENVLPPIKKVQGPFRSPASVRAQRNKPLQPTLRVETNFFHLEEAQYDLKLEEWRNRVVDDTWQPFSQYRYPYQKLLHGTSQYGHLKDDYLREEKPDRHVGASDFKRVNSPVPIFEKLGDTYSKGAGAIC